MGGRWRGLVPIAQPGARHQGWRARSASRTTCGGCQQGSALPLGAAAPCPGYCPRYCPGRGSTHAPEGRLILAEVARQQRPAGRPLCQHRARVADIGHVQRAPSQQGAARGGARQAVVDGRVVQLRVGQDEGRRQGNGGGGREFVLAGHVGGKLREGRGGLGWGVRMKAARRQEGGLA